LSTTPPTIEQLQATIAERDAALAKAESTLRKVRAKRDAAVAEAAKIRTEREAERIEPALCDAFAKSGADPRSSEDFPALAWPHFTVDAKTGAVVTMPDAANTVPGANAEAWIVAELRVKRSHWWPTSIGAGARGAGFVVNRGPDDSMFNPRSPNYNFTAQLAAEAKYGPAFADRARQRYGRGGAR
jgi:hypothetical protein